MTDPAALREWIALGMADPGTQWSVGTFGAVAEFSRDPAEPAAVICTATTSQVSTSRGGVRFDVSDNVRAVAYEKTSKHPDQWGHAIAFCLPSAACAMNRQTVIRELGTDGNPAMPAILRASPHRVFLTRIGRGEVYQAIPPTDGRSPDGPHTHLLPKLFRSGRTHAATTPIPQGWTTCIHLYPAHPRKDGFGNAQTFDRARHETFQKALAQFGDPALTDLKRRVVDSVAIGSDPKELIAPPNRYSRAAIRVALRQALAIDGPSARLTAWRREYDSVRDDVSDDGNDERIAPDSSSPEGGLQ